MPHDLEVVLITAMLLATGFLAGWLHASVHWWARLQEWRKKAAKWDALTGAGLPPGGTGKSP